jgi:serine/threonine protein kinase
MEYATQDPEKKKTHFTEIEELLKEDASPTASKLGKDSAYEIAFDEDHDELLKAFNSSCDEVKCNSESIFYMDLNNSPDSRSGIPPSVFVGYFKYKREKFAVKRIIEHERYTRELEIMRNICRGGGHRNILSLVDWKETRRYCYIVTELCAGSLQQIADQNKELLVYLYPEGMTKENRLDLIKQLVEGVNFMQTSTQYFIVHRDLKLDNILVHVNIHNGTVTLKVADLGCGKRLHRHRATLTEARGHADFRAPELFVGGPLTNDAVLADNFSVGCIIYILFDPTKHLFQMPGQDYSLIPLNIQNNNKDMENLEDEEIKSVTDGLTQHQPSERATLTETLDHSAFNEAVQKKDDLFR